jgi:hypothetical protein
MSLFLIVAFFFVAWHGSSPKALSTLSDFAFQ